MKKIVFLVVLVLLACEKKSITQDFAAKATFTLGKTEFSTSQSQWQALKPKQILHWGQFVKTGSASKLTLSFFQKMFITLYAQTEVQLLQGDAQENFNLKLNNGKLYHEASPLKGSYQLRTPTITLAVRGTKFFVETDKNTDRVKVTQGFVAVKRNIEGFETPETLLKAGDEVEVSVQENQYIQNQLLKGQTPKNLKILPLKAVSSNLKRVPKPKEPEPKTTPKPANVSRSRNRNMY